MLEERRLLALGNPELISVGSSGSEAGNSVSDYEFQSLSADGKYQVFASEASNLVANDANGKRDVFLRNLATGTVTLVSQSSTGSSANGWSQEPVISADGTYVAFSSYATNLNVTGINSTFGNLQVYRWNRLTGETVLVSQNSSGTDGANSASSLPVISDDGLRIAFATYATDVRPGITDNNSLQDIYLRDYRESIPVSILVSRSAANPNTTANGYSGNHKMSGNGSRIAYQSSATNLEAGVWDVNGTGYETVVFDVASQMNSIISLTTSQITSGNNQSEKTASSLSADGRYEAFSSLSSDLVPGDLNQTTDVFLRDLVTGVTTLISRTATGESANGSSYQAVISSDGNYVAFRSNAINLNVTGINSANYWSQVYRWSRLSGETVLVSINAGGDNGGGHDSQGPSISGNGQRIAFESYANDLLTGVTDANSGSDIYLRDFVGGTGTTTLVSRMASDPHNTGNRPSSSPIMSRDGSRIVYRSYAMNLDADTTDINGLSGEDLVVFEIASSINEFVSVQTDEGTTGNSSSERSEQSLSADGRYEVFTSWSNDLVINDTNTTMDVFLKDLQTGAITLISQNTLGYSANGSSFSASISPDGQYVVFVSTATDLTVTGIQSNNGNPQIYRWHRPTSQIVLVSVNAAGDNGAGNYSESPTISGDGLRIAFLTYATDLVSGINDSNSTLDLYVRDFSTSTPTTLLVSRSSSDPMVTANGSSWKARISRNGSRIAYLNSGDNLAAGITDGNTSNWDLYSFEMSSTTNSAVNLIPGGNRTGNQGVTDRFDLSETGSLVTFSTPANDLHPADTDYAFDVYARDFSLPFTGLELISVNSRSEKGAGFSDSPSISGDGSLIAFASYSELDPLDTNLNGTRSDIYVRNRNASTTQLISLNRSGDAGGNSDSSSPQISWNGSVISFTSYASDLDLSISDTNSSQDVFLRAWQASTRVILVSQNSTGFMSGNSSSHQPEISDTGLRIVYSTYATDMAAGFVDVNGTYEDLFSYDGNSLTLVTAKASHSFTGKNSIYPDFDISDDGKIIAFTSGANGIVADAITGTHLYVRDLTLPNRPTSERVSVDDSENTYWGYSAEPSISGDGRYVAFETNLILDPLDTNPSSYDIYVRDRTAGDTTLISVNASGTGEGNNQSMRPAISADGAYIAFESYASNLDSTVTDGNGTVDVFLRSWKNTPSKTTLASRRETGTESADAYSNSPELSENGSRLVYQSSAQNLLDTIPDVNGNSFDLYAFDGTNNQLVSVKSTGKFTGNVGWYGPFDISKSGLQIAFSTNSAGMVPFSAPGQQVYVRDYVSHTEGITELISFDAAGKPGNAASQNPTISGDGSVVAFESIASLAPIDGSAGWPWDIYVCDRTVAKTFLISVNSAGTNAGDSNSSGARINRDGTTVVWSSYASNLDGNVTDSNNDSDIFYRNWKASDSRTEMLSRDSSGLYSSNGYSSRPILSDLATTAVFNSTATNLTNIRDSNNTNDIFFVRAAALGIQSMTPPTFEQDSATTSYAFKINRTWMTTGNHTVKWKVVPYGTSPVNTADFGGSFPEGIVTFSTGETEKTVNIFVSGDLDVEDDETFAIQLYDSTNHSQIVESQAIGTILNNDIDLVIEAVQLNELEGNTGTTSFRFLAKRLGYSGTSTDAAWTTSGISSIAADAADFGGTFPSGSLHFVIGQTEILFEISVTGDSLVERNESFAVTLADPSPNAEITVGSAMCNIINDDSATIGLVDISGNEATGSLLFRVGLSNPVDTAISVNFSTLASGTALAGIDFTTITNQVVTFPAGSAATQPVTVTVANDNLVELAETVHAKIDTLMAAGRDVSIGTSSATGTIANDDSASILLVGVAANEATGQLNFTITISNPVDTPVSVNFRTLLTGTALAGVDYTAISGQTVTLPAGSTDTQTVPVTVLDDLWVETDETVIAEISELESAGRDVQIMSASAVGTIRDDDIVKIVSRKIYYRGSSFQTLGGVSGAIDSSKILAQPSATTQQLGFVNLINTTSGINGLVFDVAGLEATSLAPSDFLFRMSPTGSFNEAANPPSSWGAAPSPMEIAVTPGTANTPARVRIDWTDNAIANRWLQVKVLANNNTGLVAPQVYYIGHLYGEVNGTVSGGVFSISIGDATAIRPHVGFAAPVTSPYDLNKNGSVSIGDITGMRPRVGLATLRAITIPPAGSGEEGEGGTGGIPSSTPVVALPKIELSPDRAISQPSEIRSRLTDEVFDVPLPANGMQGVADATPWQPIRSANDLMTDSASPQDKLSIDEYFRRFTDQPAFADVLFASFSSNLNKRRRSF